VLIEIGSRFRFVGQFSRWCKWACELCSNHSYAFAFSTWLECVRTGRRCKAERGRRARPDCLCVCLASLRGCWAATDQPPKAVLGFSRPVRGAQRWKRWSQPAIRGTTHRRRGGPCLTRDVTAPGSSRLAPQPVNRELRRGRGTSRGLVPQPQCRRFFSMTSVWCCSMNPMILSSAHSEQTAADLLRRPA